jgi:predicted O-methyltransferase YrrM
MTRAERLLLYALVFALRPRRYLEIGTFKGGSALIVSAAMDALDTAGRVVCVDVAPEILPEHWNRLEHRTTLLKGTSPDILPQAKAAAGGAFDFVLIDADHSHAGVVRDVRGVIPYVAPDGHLVCHDGYNPGVAAAIRDIKREYRRQILDLGLLTREITYGVEGDGQPVRWGGLHVMRLAPAR